MAEDREERMEALRARVKAKKEAALSGGVIEEELVVSTTNLDQSGQTSDSALLTNDWDELIDLDADRWRNLAAALIFIGSILGMLSGALILQGNPSELLNDIFAESETVDVTGSALEDVDGHGVEGVLVELFDEDRIKQDNTTTDEFGYFTIENVVQEVHIIIFSKEGYETFELTFLPDNVGLDPVTMKPGEGTYSDSDLQSTTGWTLESAVGLSTIIGAFTLATALLGVQSAIEIRRGKHYRRSQYLAGGALFSRGLIIVGPALILFGMIVNLFAKNDFEDQRDD
tara:strand:+ start:2857 stop:3714 length:858 start_codon:yes stop_codon:yes gene_type:complete